MINLTLKVINPEIALICFTGDTIFIFTEIAIINLSQHSNNQYLKFQINYTGNELQ